MADTIVTFQSELSGVMETVFKAAMYEITRLVERSFVEEVTRCREQVESLSRRVKRAESRRKDRGGDRRARCVDCGRVRLSAEEKHKAMQKEKSVKQKRVVEVHASSPPTSDEGSSYQEVESHNSMETIQSLSGQGEMLDRQCKEEVLHTTAKQNRSKEIWKVILDEESLKQAFGQNEDLDSLPTSGAASGQEVEEHRGMKTSQSLSEQAEKLDKWLKDEAGRMIPQEIESKERWGVNFDETEASSLPGPSKCLTDQKSQRCPAKREAGLEQRSDLGQSVNSGEQSEPVLRNRYDVGDFEKTRYEVSGMIDVSKLQGSPSQPADNLSNMSHHQGDADTSGKGENQPSETGSPKNERAAAGSPAASSSRNYTDVSGELSCWLINEKGYLQGQTILYPVRASGFSSERMSIQGQRIITDACVNNSGDPNGPSDILNNDKLSSSLPASASLKTNKKTHKGSGQGPRHSCQHCGKTFTQASNLKVHQRIHSGQGLQLCGNCGKGFPSFSDLKTHKCGQMGNKSYTCTVCGKTFSRLWNLKLHQKIHSQEKPHQCTKCDKSFARADKLRMHLLIHSGERPHCCAVCGLRFKRQDHLKAHQRKHIQGI